MFTTTVADMFTTVNAMIVGTARPDLFLTAATTGDGHDEDQDVA